MLENCNLENYNFLNKPYKLIAFDWDGTAVKNRQADATEITGVIEALLKKGVIIAVITGTNVNNILARLTTFTVGIHLKNLFLLTNRGSEVYSFDENKKLVLIHHRQATAAENLLLDKIANKVKNEITSGSNSQIEIISNRMNRRKIDLIPQWKNPQKSEIELLLKETENNLRENGFSGGIKKAYELLKTIVRSTGFNDLKITSDVKHLEVGLTDKSDSMWWIIEKLAFENKINTSEILVGGDEFGNIAGFAGSDSKMILKDYPDITYFSVGVEPEGSPVPVIYVGGGPACFYKILKRQVEINSKD